MRFIPEDLKSKLEETMQTHFNNANPSLAIKVSRPDVPLVNQQFLERYRISTDGNVTDVDIAVSHPTIDSQNKEVTIAYVSNGYGKISSSPHYTRMSSHVFYILDFHEQAEKISIAYDGKFEKNVEDIDEFITEKYPWVAWVHNGVLTARKINANMPDVILAESNCTAVSLVRGTWSEVSKFDYGLIAFFILNGNLFYRQYINGVWYDAEVVNAIPGHTWVDVAAYRTWDYRVGVQLKDSNGEIYDLLTQFMGIGSRNIEHIDVVNITNEPNNMELTYLKGYSDNEHVELSSIYTPSHSQPNHGSYEIGPLYMLSAYNQNDGEGNYGKQIVVEFNKEIDIDSIGMSVDNFIFTDDSDKRLIPQSVSRDWTGRIVTFKFVSFNDAVGNISIEYLKTLNGVNAKSMAGYELNEDAVSFTPINLDPSIDCPSPESISNSYGTIVITFDDDISGSVTDSLNSFRVIIQEIDYSRTNVGEIKEKDIPVVGGAFTSLRTISLNFGPGNTVNMENNVGRVTVRYSGNENLFKTSDSSKLVNSFILSFKPSDEIPYKGPTIFRENVECTNIVQNADCKKIEYTNTKHDEHVEVFDISLESVCKHIDDI